LTVRGAAVSAIVVNVIVETGFTSQVGFTSKDNVVKTGKLRIEIAIKIISDIGSQR
jgi:hypothetical protein